MISDLDIYRSANLLIDRRGEKALVHAAMRADELLTWKWACSEVRVTPVREGEDPRAGRWRDSGKEECGIHFDGEKWVRGPVSGESFDSP